MISSSDDITFQIMAEQYLNFMLKRGDSEETVKVRRRYLRYFMQWAELRGLTNPREVTRDAVDSYQTHLFNHRKADGKPLGWASQKSRISAVKMWFSFMAGKYIIMYNPASEVKIPKTGTQLPKDLLSKEDVEKICAQISIKSPEGIRDRMIVEILWATGIRRKALGHLRLNDIDFERQLIFIRQGKGRKDRYVPFSDRCMNWIRIYLDEARDKLLGCEKKVESLILTIRGKPMQYDYLTQLVGRYIKKAELGKKGSCHIFRHSCASAMHDNGCDIRVLQEFLGHENLETTKIYTKVSIPKVKESYRLTHPSCVPSNHKRKQD